MGTPADRDRSRAWWEQRLASGICAACRRALPDDFAFSTPVHTNCAYLAGFFTYRAIRAMTPADIEEMSALLRADGRERRLAAARRRRR